MADEVSTRGAEDFLALSKRLKAAGQTELRKELNKGLRDAAKPLIGKTRQAFAGGLPRRGGLAQVISRRPMRVKVATGTNPGVSIVAAKTDRRIDEGVISHPVFGRRPNVTQRVTSGLFSETLQQEAPAIRVELVAAVDRMTDRVAGG